MSRNAQDKHPILWLLDGVIFLLAVAEFVEGIAGTHYLRLWTEESGLQLVLLAVRAYAVWHALHPLRR